MALDQTSGRSVKPLWVAHHGDRDIRVGDGRRPACVVDHVQDATFPRTSSLSEIGNFPTGRIVVHWRS